ncbi:MAG: DUF5615 family PIN-like protein [Tepidiformaceae bacterium]
MKLLLDMNIDPAWVDILEDAGYETAHWSTLGDGRARDEVIAEWARAHDWVVVTYDRDFGDILASSGAAGPSVILIRARNARPRLIGKDFFWLLTRFAFQLNEGALIVYDHGRHRVRMLPIA